MRRYQITYVEVDVTKVMTERQAQQTFGKAEWKEIKAGYDPEVRVTSL